MGASTSTDQNITIRKTVYDEYVSKYCKTVRELSSVKNRVSQLEKQRQIQEETGQNINDLQGKLVRTTRLLNAELNKNKDSESLAKILNEKEQNLNDLNREYVNLQSDNTQLKTELEEVNEKNLKLNEEMNKLKKDLNKMREEMENLKLERNVNELEDELKKKDALVTQRELIQIYHRIEELQDVISIKRDIIAKKTKEAERDDKDKMIEKLKSDYANYKRILESKDITVNSTNFIDAYAKYKHLSLRNRDIKKEIFRQVYQIEKSMKDCRKKYDHFASDLSKDLERNEKRDKNLNMNLLMQSLDAEEELYQDVLRVSEEKISVWEKFLEIDKPINFPSPTSTSVDSKSLILFNALEDGQSENEDYLMVSQFLDQNGIVDKNVNVKRLGKSYPNFNRPLIIHFTNRYCVDRILQLSKNNGWFHGCNPSISRF